MIGTPDPAAAPAAADSYLATALKGAVGAVIVWRVDGGDADLYVADSVSDDLTHYPAFSDNAGEASEELRLDGLSDPTFGTLLDGGIQLVVAVIGAVGAPAYRLDMVYVGPSMAGDADCDSSVNANDVSGLARALFDASVRLTSDGPFGRCIGGDANRDGHETVADIVAAMRTSAT